MVQPQSAQTQSSDCGASSRAFRFDVRVPAQWNYPVLFQSGLLSRYGALFRETFGDAGAIVLTDRRVERLYGDALRESMNRVGLEPGWIAVPDGEGSKDLETFARLLDRLAELECDRRTVLVNFGGGVISDLGGFVASAYMRGIPYANLSTSLLGQIDACVGGKVAVNSPRAKNLIGAFYHPRHVAGDPALLASLSRRDFRSGLAEGIKVGVIASPTLFGVFEKERERIQSGDPATLARVIGTAAQVKMDLIGQDPYEADLRRPLNFGHTIGHPLETEFGYKKIRHGEAVAIGMGVATAIALRKRMVELPAARRIFDVLRAYDLLGFSEPLRPDAVVEHVRYVRLIRGKSLHFVLPARIGGVHITELENADLVRGFEDYDEYVQGRPLE